MTTRGMYGKSSPMRSATADQRRSIRILARIAARHGQISSFYVTWALGEPNGPVCVTADDVVCLVRRDGTVFWLPAKSGNPGAGPKPKKKSALGWRFNRPRPRASTALPARATA